MLHAIGRGGIRVIKPRIPWWQLALKFLPPSALGRPFVPIVYRVPDAPLVKKSSSTRNQASVSRCYALPRDLDFLFPLRDARNSEKLEDDSMPFAGLAGFPTESRGSIDF